MSMLTNFLKQFMDVCIYGQVPLEDCINPQADGIPDNIIVPVLLLVSTSALTVYYFIGRNGSGGSPDLDAEILETFESGDVRSTEPPPEMSTNVLNQDAEEEITA